MIVRTKPPRVITKHINSLPADQLDYRSSSLSNNKRHPPPASQLRKILVFAKSCVNGLYPLPVTVASKSACLCMNAFVLITSHVVRCPRGSPPPPSTGVAAPLSPAPPIELLNSGLLNSRADLSNDTSASKSVGKNTSHPPTWSRYVPRSSLLPPGACVATSGALIPCVS